MYTKIFKAREIFDDGSRHIDYSVAVEDTIDLFVNKLHMAAILATPEMLEELVMGYLICEGVIKNPIEVKELRIDGRTINVEIETSDDFEIWRELRS
ncbi:MAG: formate dehydrogenase accessory sulfurtransferase FdhD, partial [Candidatus Methanoperedens sp.]|nr:formate dehydrogenase accessory sulfurtransferase FdhD [Candidatus Methanoperedens sp.]